MWWIFPYRVKNPPERFPYVTLSLIAVNVLVFLCTLQWSPDADGFLSTREDAVAALALSHNQFTLVRMVTMMFLHANLLHILGNMWFLWLFGPSVEGRLGPGKFIGLYMLSGCVGSVCEDVLEAYMMPDMPCMGASGAIMGLTGAYLYIFPCASFRVFYFYWLLLVPRFGTVDWYARWVVLYYFIFDLIQGMISRTVEMATGIGSGVAQFAHIGGAITGFLFVAILGVRRDTENVSLAQAVRADTGGYAALTMIELETLMQRPVDDMLLVLTYCEKAIAFPGQFGGVRCAQAVSRYAQQLIAFPEQRRVALVFLSIDGENAAILPSVYYLKIGSNLESQREYDLATRIYRRIVEVQPRSPDAAVALLRCGRLMESVYRNIQYARYYYSELLRAHPSSPLASDASRALNMLT